MPTRRDLIDKARTWIDVPTRPSGSQRHGVNCLGLFVGVIRELGGFEEAVEEAEKYVGFKGPTTPQGLLRALRSSNYLKIIPRPFPLVPGNMLLVFTHDGPQHLVILTEPRVVLHAAQKKGKVVEHLLSDGWMVSSEFELIGLDD